MGFVGAAFFRDWITRFAAGVLAGADSDYITGQTIVVDGGMVFH